ncbi:MAG TPA: L,D-transpeptidase family protein [Azospirillaceae bacterium]|nr:L,D-transpeptidase family protein [Azospirillaceae bacterium]
MSLLPRLFFAAVLILGSASPMAVIAGPSAGVGAVIAGLLGPDEASNPDGMLKLAGRPVDRAVIERIYAPRQYAPVWLNEGSDTSGPALHPRGEAVLRHLGHAETEGLDPADYHVGDIAARVGGADARALAEFDLLLTDALARFARDVRIGRVAPRSVDGDILIVPPSLDLAETVLAVVEAPDVEARLAALPPPHPEYANLRAALARMRKVAKAGGWAVVGEGQVLRPGMQDPNVAAVRRHLIATGDLQGPAKGPDKGGDVYDPKLEGAVRRFQARHGIDVDGVVGVQTRAHMNITAAERTGQILANMERWRWMPDDLGRRHVVVNVPAFTLAAREGGETKLDMRVVVGTNTRRTPMLASRITGTTFNPTWTVPPRNAKEDVLPKLQRNAGYLDEMGMRVYAGWQADAPLVNPRTVDWRGVGTRITRYRLVQQPGPLNALGRFKFNIPNEQDIYLHDTPQHDKFARSQRTFSSGCVRLSEPDALNTWLFATQPDWDESRTQTMVESGKTRTVRLPEAIPVYLLYQTAWMDAAGVFHFREDIYGRDAQFSQIFERKREMPVRTARLAS